MGTAYASKQARFLRRQPSMDNLPKSPALAVFEHMSGLCTVCNHRVDRHSQRVLQLSSGPRWACVEKDCYCIELGTFGKDLFDLGEVSVTT